MCVCVCVCVCVCLYICDIINRALIFLQCSFATGFIAFLCIAHAFHMVRHNKENDFYWFNMANPKICLVSFCFFHCVFFIVFSVFFCLFGFQIESVNFFWGMCFRGSWQHQSAYCFSTFLERIYESTNILFTNGQSPKKTNKHNTSTHTVKKKIKTLQKKFCKQKTGFECYKQCIHCTKNCLLGHNQNKPGEIRYRAETNLWTKTKVQQKTIKYVCNIKITIDYVLLNVWAAIVMT